MYRDTPHPKSPAHTSTTLHSRTTLAASVEELLECEPPPAPDHVVTVNVAIYAPNTVQLYAHMAEHYKHLKVGSEWDGFNAALLLHPTARQHLPRCGKDKQSC